MELSFSFDGKETLKKLARMAEGLKDMTAPFERSGESLLEFFKGEVFESQGAALGERWRDHSASTKIARAKRWGYYKSDPVADAKVLVWSGRIRAGFKKQVSKNSLRIYNEDENFKKNQPSRKMLRITSKVIEIVTRDVYSHIKDVTR